MLKEKATEFYVELDDFRREFESELENRPFPVDTKVKRRNRKGRPSGSGMMAIFLLLHYRWSTNFKHFYTRYVQANMDDLFPYMISYERSNARQERILLPLLPYLKYRGLGLRRASTISIRPLIRVCHFKREERHRVFKGVAKKGKPTMG